jgi:hypothetical protein
LLHYAKPPLLRLLSSDAEKADASRVQLPLRISSMLSPTVLVVSMSESKRVLLLALDCAAQKTQTSSEIG